jgi:general secretion pathway protein F
MPSFRHVAIGPGGVLSQGVMEAASEAAVVEQLRRQGSIPMRIEPADRGRLADLLPSGLLQRRGLGRQEVADLTRELAVMLGAGQDLDRALRFLIETAARPRVARVLGALRDAVRDGSAFAAALAQHPDSFSRLYVGLVRAGEAGGALAPTLDRLATLLDRQRALSATVTSALIYPGVLLLAAVGSVVLLLTEVLPQFVPLFADSGAALPTSTRLIIAAGDALGAWGLPSLVGLAGLLLVAGRVLQRPGPRFVFDRLRLRHGWTAAKQGCSRSALRYPGAGLARSSWTVNAWCPARRPRRHEPTPRGRVHAAGDPGGAGGARLDHGRADPGPALRGGGLGSAIGDHRP